MGVYGSIEVGDNVFLGVNSIILPGKKIGSNSIVGAGSVVTKDVPPGVVVAGNPAKVISTLQEYRIRAIQQAINIDISSKAQIRADLIEHFWPKIRK
jgi:acetyltransferase-like isoleucine patch superfamily enzyme